MVSQSWPTLWLHGPQSTRLGPSVEFSRQEYWSGLPLASPGDLPNPGTEPMSRALWAYSLLSEPPGIAVIPLQWRSREASEKLLKIHWGRGSPRSRNSSVGRALDWSSKGPWFNPGFWQPNCFHLHPRKWHQHQRKGAILAILQRASVLAYIQEESYIQWKKMLVAQSYPTVWLHGPQSTRLGLSVEFSRQEYWSGLPFPSLLRIFPTVGSNLGLSTAGIFFTIWAARHCNCSLTMKKQGRLWETL